MSDGPRGHLAGGLQASRSTIMPGGPGGRGHQARIAHGHEPVVQRCADRRGLAPDPGRHGGVDHARPQDVDGDTGSVGQFGRKVEGVGFQRGLEAA